MMLVLALFIVVQWLPSSEASGTSGEIYNLYQAPLDVDGNCGAFVKIASVTGLLVKIADTPAMEQSCYLLTFFDGTNESEPSDIFTPQPWDSTPVGFQADVQAQ